MPSKSLQTNGPAARPEHRLLVQVEVPNVNANSCYRTFSEFCKRINNLKSLTEWSLKVLSDRVVLKKEDPYLIPKLEIVVHESLAYTVVVYGAYL